MKYKYLILLFALIPLFTRGEIKSVYQLKTVVIDAGHGGKDPGCIGKICKEKDIALKVALQLGSYIKQNMPEVKVIYTRSTDVFVELKKRADIANKAKADLFISVHVNSLPRETSSAKRAQVAGTETYLLGIYRSADNLAVAKMENSVITYEDNYKQKYEGFDPQSSESYIIFNFMQNKYLDQSLQIAQLVQNNFRLQAGRSDRGVRQAGFLVLRETGMPSVLVELGYISNAKEEKYMSSAKGVENLAGCIFNAFKEYKQEIERKSLLDVVSVSKPEPIPVVQNKPATSTPRIVTQTVTPAVTPPISSFSEIVFKVQLFSTGAPVSEQSNMYKKYRPLSYYMEDGRYRYMTGYCLDYNEARAIRKKVLSTYKDAFIVAFEGKKRISLKEAMKKLGK